MGSSAPADRLTRRVLSQRRSQGVAQSSSGLSTMTSCPQSTAYVLPGGIALTCCEDLVSFVELVLRRSDVCLAARQLVEPTVESNTLLKGADRLVSPDRS